VLPLRPPRLDGSTWLPRDESGRASFEVSTLYEMAQRAAFEPIAHELAEQLLDAVLPLLPIGSAGAAGAAADAAGAVDSADEPYVQRILMVAAQVGAGIGLVESRSLAPPSGLTDRRTWTVLWTALRDLPTMPPTQRFAAAYLMQAGPFLARVGDGGVSDVAADLRDELARSAR
jgi:hypothetical protein